MSEDANHGTHREKDGIRVSVHSNVGHACARNILDGPDVLRPPAYQNRGGGFPSDLPRHYNRTIKARCLRDTLCPKSAL